MNGRIDNNSYNACVDIRHINFVSGASQKIDDENYEKLYLIQCKKFGESLSYHLKSDGDEYQLVSNLSPHDAVSPRNSKYIFVIVERPNEKPQLRIGHGSHYYLANKAKSVLAAGEIEFADKRILSINNQSGSYHIDTNKLTVEQHSQYLAHLQGVYDEVGLPYDKFTSYINNKNPTQYNSWANLFSKRLVITAAVTTSVIACAAVSSLTKCTQ